MGPDSGPLSGKVRPLATLTSETNMRFNACDAEKRTTLHTDLGAIFASLELSGASGKLVEIFRAADNLRDNDVTLRDSPHDYSRPGPEP